jgi:hypothetical protein
LWLRKRPAGRGWRGALTRQTGEAIIKLRTSLVAAGAAVVLGTTGAFLLPAVANAHSASAPGATHTLKYVAVSTATVGFTRATGDIQDTDVNAVGKTVGFDIVYFKAASASTLAVNTTVDTKGGFLYGTFTFNFKTDVVTNGKVTGGTGAFAGATGTIKVKTISRTRHAVTITYSS